MIYIIVGASRGLGAALVNACLQDGRSTVIGIGRSAVQDIQQHEKWTNSKRFRYYQADVAAQAGKDALISVRNSLPPEGVCVIFNAAVMAADVSREREFLRDIYDRVCAVGVAGFGNLVDVFGPHLRAYRGTLVGISSLSAWVPPFFNQRISYPASKAFLTMALRALRTVWGRDMKIVAVFLGSLGNENETSVPRWLVPSYERAAKKIVRSLNRSSIPSSIYFPVPMCVLYRVLNVLPDALLFPFMERINGLLSKAKRSAGQ